jgi:hypothetical protein
MKTKEDYWKALKGKGSLKKIAEEYGLTNESLQQIENDQENMSDIDCILMLSVISRFILADSYIELVNLKEIDDTIVFNLYTKEFHNHETREGDFGMKGYYMLVFENKQWKHFTTFKKPIKR